MSIKNLFNTIKKGKEGKNIGISTGLSKLDSIIYGIQKGYLYTVGASSGIGKTSFTLDIFVYNLIKNAKDIPISILLYSFEMSKEVLLAKLLSRYIYDVYSKIITFEQILSLSKAISDENYEYVLKCEKWLEELDSKLTIYDKPLSPSAIYATCKGWLEEFGEFLKISDHKEEYIEKDSSRYKVVITDHIGLVSGTGTKKERIDIVADYMIYFRNKCNITGIFVQQLNRGISSVDRKTQGFELVGLEDFKDSSGTTDASEIVIALYSPYREKVAKCEGYSIQNVLKEKFILVEIIKNRYGRAGVNLGTVFHGNINMFLELPLPNEISDYEPYLNLNYNKDEIKENEDVDENNEIMFKF